MGVKVKIMLTQEPSDPPSCFDYPPQFFFLEKKGLRMVQFSEKIDKKNVFFGPKKIDFFWGPGDFFGAGPKKRAQHMKKC